MPFRRDMNGAQRAPIGCLKLCRALVPCLYEPTAKLRDDHNFYF